MEQISIPDFHGLAMQLQLPETQPNSDPNAVEVALTRQTQLLSAIDKLHQALALALLRLDPELWLESSGRHSEELDDQLEQEQ